MIDTKHKLHALDLARWAITDRSSSQKLFPRFRFVTMTTTMSVILLSLVTFKTAYIYGQEGPSVETKTEANSNESDVKTASPAEQDKPKTDVPAEEKKNSDPPIAIVNGLVYTMKGPPIEGGRIVVRGSLIEAVGDEKLSLPDNAQIIDAKGLSITPGWIDVNSQLWMSDSPNDAGASDGSLLATDSLDPFAEDWADVLNAGVTTVYVQPSSAGSMSGLGAAVSVAPLAPGSLQILNSSAGLQMSLGNAPSNRDRAARFESIKKTLQAVVDYKKKWDEYEKSIKEAATKAPEAEKPAAAPTPGEAGQRPSGDGFGRSRRGRENPGEERRPGPPQPPGTPQPPGNGPPGSGTPNPSGSPATQPPSDNSSGTKDSSSTSSGTPTKEAPKKPVKPEKDVVKDRLIGVIVGKIPVRFEVKTANDVRYAVDLKKTFPDVQWVWEGLDQLGSSLQEIKISRTPIVVGPFLNLGIPSKVSTERIEQLSKLLDGYQGVVVVQTKSIVRNGSRLLREQLASSATVGLSKDTLLRSVTVDAARLIGCDKEIGTIAPGFKADLIGFSGHPLDTTSSTALIVSNGKIHKQTLMEATGTREQVTNSSTSNEFASAISQLANGAVLKSSRLLLSDGVSTCELSIEGGKIVKLSSLPESSPASSDKVIDIGNTFVTPGLVSVYSTFGLDANARGTDSDSSNLTSSDLSLSDQRNNNRMENTGLFKVALSTSSANTLAGQLSLFSTDLDHSKLTGQIGAKIVLSSEARSVDRFPSSLAGQVKFVRDAFDGKRTPSRLFVPDATLSGLDKSKSEAIAKLRDRKQLALFQVTDEAEIEAAIRIVRDYKLRAAFVGSTSWASYAPELKELGIAIIALPIRESDFPIYIEDLVTCHKSGIEVYFGGETGDQIRVTAGLAVRHGMNANWARFAIHNGHTKLFPECEGKLGFKAGEPADVLVWSGDPLNLSSKILARMRNGKIIVSEENQ